MEWDEEEAPPRAQEKVRELFRRVMSRRERHTTAVAAAKAKAKASTMAMANTTPMQQLDHNATSTVGYTSPVQLDEKVKGGSIRNARRGIAERRKLEVGFSPQNVRHHLLT
jgi:hypothetical protein